MTADNNNGSSNIYHTNRNAIADTTYSTSRNENQ
jgi:hypothetical protein